MASSLELLMLAQASVTDTQVLQASTLVNSTSFSALLSSPVAAGGGGYYLRAVIGCLANASAGAPEINVAVGGSGAVPLLIGYGFSCIGGGVTSTYTWKTATGSTCTGVTMTNGSFYQLTLEGTISFSVGGTLALNAATTVAADTWTAQAGSFFTMRALP